MDGTSSRATLNLGGGVWDYSAACSAITVLSRRQTEFLFQILVLRKKRSQYFRMFKYGYEQHDHCKLIANSNYVQTIKF
jgi:hypothetical protein